MLPFLATSAADEMSAGLIDCARQPNLPLVATCLAKMIGEIDWSNRNAGGKPT
jgi:hypothetical protein